MSEIAKNISAAAALTDEFPPTRRPRPDPAQRRELRDGAREEGFAFSSPDPVDDSGGGEGEPEAAAQGAEAPAQAESTAVAVLPVRRREVAVAAPKKTGRVKLSEATGAKVFRPGEPRAQMNVYAPVSVATEFYELERQSGVSKAELISMAIPLLRTELKLKAPKR